MRLASYRTVLSLFGFVALGSLLSGCPEKGAPPDKTTAEPERNEPDDEGKATDSKKPSAVAPAHAPAPAPAPADDKKADDEKDKGGW